MKYKIGDKVIRNIDPSFEWKPDYVSGIYANEIGVIYAIDYNVTHPYVVRWEKSFNKFNYSEYQLIVVEDPNNILKKLI